MNPERLVAGLDIGSAKTTAIIAEVVGDLPKHPTIKILGVGQARTTGMRRGVVSDIEETTRSIKKAMQDAERMAGAQDRRRCTPGIAGEHVQAMTSKGIVAVSGDEITKSDVDRANEVARAQAIPQDRELLHAIPQEYTVDKNTGIRDPIGMSGTRLETEMYLVTIGARRRSICAKSVERAGYKVRELVLEPLASALGVLTEDEKELGVALVEMGAGTTDLAVFHEGKIRHLGTVDFGGNNVTSDIVHGLGVTQADAERLKERYGCAYEPLVDPSEVIQLPSTVAQGDRQIPRELLAHIIHQRMDEIFDLVQREIATAGFAGKLSGGRRAHGRRGGDAGRRRAGERRVRHRRARRHSGGEHRRAERFGGGAALRDGGRPRAVRREPLSGWILPDQQAQSARRSRRRQVHEADEDLAPGFLLAVLQRCLCARQVHRWSVGRGYPLRRRRPLGRSPSLRSFAPLSRGSPRSRPWTSPTRTPSPSFPRVTDCAKHRGATREILVATSRPSRTESLPSPLASGPTTAAVGARGASRRLSSERELSTRVMGALVISRGATRVGSLQLKICTGR